MGSERGIREKNREKLKEKIDNFLKTHGGIVKTADLNEIGVNYRQLQKLLEEKTLLRVKNGYYTNESKLCEEQLIQALFPDAVLCMDTALYVYRYINTKPAYWHLAVDKDTSKARFKTEYPRIKPYYTEEHVLKSGVTEIEVCGVLMHIYDKERMMCDCIRYESHMEPAILRQALFAYIKDEEKNIRKLNRYAKERNVSNKVHNMLGVWIG